MALGTTEKVKDLVVVIENGDDRPLITENVKGLQTKHYLVADLEKNGHYTVSFGNNKLDAPVYDLKYFANQIPDSMDILSVSEPVKLSPGRERDKAVEKQTGSSRLMIWLAIGLVGAMLLFLAGRLLKDMKDKS